MPASGSGPAPEHVPAEERERLWGADAPLEYSHTLAEQIGGQLAAGFMLTGFSEAPHQADATAGWLPGYFATRAAKPRASCGKPCLRTPTRA
jgi:hypothetical protein